MKSITLVVIFAAAISSLGRAAFALPTVDITEVELNNDSARVYFQPVAGAADYRGYALENPKEVKYAGLLHLFSPRDQHWVVSGSGAPVFPYRSAPNTPGNDKPARIDVPALNIELNGLDPDQTAHIVIEAVDHVGPSPYSNLATERNLPVSGHAKAMPATMHMDTEADAMELLGSNAGPTDDGLYSINGQSGPHARPGAIARSHPISVRPTGRPALPMTPDAEQVVFDTFGRGPIDEIPGTRDERAGKVSYIMRTDANWRIDFLNDDIFHSRPFIMNRHYMDVLFDGSTPANGLPLHIAHGVTTVSPIKNAVFTGGRMLHLTMEVDGHMDGRRWMAFNIAPYDDPITNLYTDTGNPTNRSNTALFVQFFADSIRTDLFTGSPWGERLCGALGQAPVSASRPIEDGYSGRGLDNRSRFDLFVTRSRYLVFEDGKKIVEQSFPSPLSPRLQHVKVYYTHYLYHTGNEIQEVKQYQPYEKFWIDLFPYSDERHWDNMGYEVLPARYAHETADQLSNRILASKSVRVVQGRELEAQK